MSFKITRTIAIIGLLSFVIWFSIRLSGTVETQCSIEHYGIPDFRNLSENVLELQTASYHIDYNYHRALHDQEYLNAKLNCDVTNRINYLGDKVIDGRMSRDDALQIIQSQIETIYMENGLADIRINWTIPMLEVDIDYPYMSYGAAETQVYTCSQTLEVPSNLEYKPGQLITCFTPPYYAGCIVSLERQVNFDTIEMLSAQVSLYCFFVVTIVIALALCSRWRNKLIKSKQLSVLPSINSYDSD